MQYSHTLRGNCCREERGRLHVHIPWSSVPKLPQTPLKLKLHGTAAVETGIAQLPNASKDSSSEKFKSLPFAEHKEVSSCPSDLWEAAPGKGLGLCAPSQTGTARSRLTGAQNTKLSLVAAKAVSGHMTDNQSFLPPPAPLLEMPRFAPHLCTESSAIRCF